VICVGSVWKSWEFLREGFISRLSSSPSGPDKVALLKLLTGASKGAAYLAAKAIDYDLPKCYEQNFNVFFEYSRN